MIGDQPSSNRADRLIKLKLLAQLVVLMFLSGCVQSQQSFMGEVVAPDPANWGHDFYWASQSATGSGLCDRALAEEFLDRFNRRYGPRFQRLREAYQSQFGTPPDFVVVSSCRHIDGSAQRERVRHRQSMIQFVDWLDIAERAVAAAAASQ